MKIDRSTLVTLAVMVVVLSVSAVFVFWRQGEHTQKQSPDAVLALDERSEKAYTDLEGTPVSLREFEGKVRVVNAWASWCPFCLEELQAFETLAQEYASEDVVVIAINRKETKEKAQRYLDRIGSFEHMVFVLDPDDTFYKGMQGYAMPETVFYDEEGNVVAHKRGVMDLEEMRTYTQQAMSAQNE